MMRTYHETSNSVISFPRLHIEYLAHAQGLAAARARGKRGGRPKALSPEKINLARKLYADTSTSVAEICKMLGISRHTLQRYVKE